MEAGRVAENTGMTSSWNASRGFERLLLGETQVSDLLQFLSDLDATPWSGLVGFTPVYIERESMAQNRADLVLTGNSGQRAIVEMKVGHVFDATQQRRYEHLQGDMQLYLAALGMDKQRLSADMTDRWDFLDLTTVFEAWTHSEHSVAQVFANQISTIFRSWDELLRAVFHRVDHDGEPLSRIREKSLTRVVTRRIAVDLRERGLLTYAGVTDGGGLPIVRAWTPIRNEEQDRCFIAEVRWRQNHPVGEFRFGIDFNPRPGFPEDEAVRRDAYELAQTMDSVLYPEALQAYLQSVDPHTADLVQLTQRPRPKARGNWQDIIQYGFQNVPRTSSRKPTRLQIRPEFYGDGALSFQTMTDLDFTRINASDIIELLAATLTYLVKHQPAEEKYRTLK